MPKMLPTNKDELEEAYDVVELAADYNRLVRKYRRVRRVLVAAQKTVAAYDVDAGQFAFAMERLRGVLAECTQHKQEAGDDNTAG